MVSFPTFDFTPPSGSIRGGHAYSGMQANLYQFLGDHPLTAIDPAGTSWVNLVPILGTIYNLSVDPYGVNIGDYLGGNCGGVHMRKDIQELGAPAAIEKCEECMHQELINNIQSYMGLPTTKDAMEILAALMAGALMAKAGEITAGGAISGGILAVDGLVDAAQTLNNLGRMRDAEAAAAAKSCRPLNPCPPSR